LQNQGYLFSIKEVKQKEDPVSDTLNPYQSPQNISVPEAPLVSRGELSETMLRSLKEASPWLRFIGILSFISCGFMTLGGVVATIVLLAVSSLAEEIGGSYMALLGLLYVVLGVVMFFPARFIYFFGAKIRSYQLNNSQEDLELALKNNKSLWKFFGICCIISLAFVPVGTVVGIIAAISSVFM
jgi:hypothetical protein